ncbi:hypothetical protein D3C78_1866290 [compost metagenome]
MQFRFRRRGVSEANTDVITRAQPGYLCIGAIDAEAQPVGPDPHTVFMFDHHQPRLLVDVHYGQTQISRLLNHGFGGTGTF